MNRGHPFLMYQYPVLRGDLVATPTALRLIRSDGIPFVLDSHRDLLGVLRLLDGEHCWEDVNQALPGIDLAEDFISWLTQNDLLAPRQEQPFQKLRVRLYGTGTLAQKLSCQILEEEPRSLTLVSQDPRTHLKDYQAVQLLHELNRLKSDRSEIYLDQHWVCSDDQPDIAIIAGPGIQPDRAILEDLRLRAIPTLLVMAHHDFAQIGPLFTPGVSCWRCADAQMQTIDPAWPECVPALCLTPPRPSHTAVRWAAAWAVAQLMLWCATGESDLKTSSLGWSAMEPKRHIKNFRLCKECLDL